MNYDQENKILASVIIAVAVSVMVVVMTCAIKESIKADKQYCMEQTRYEYNDCIVMLQG